MEQLRKYCLSFPGATEEIKWGADLCFCVGAKMFCVTGADSIAGGMSIKCTPERFDELIEREGIDPAASVERYKWVHITDLNAVTPGELKSLIEESYELVFDKLLRRSKKLSNSTPNAWTHNMIIAIDGPSGAGKSTLGKMLAKKLKLLYLDTGAMYRAVALAVTRAGVPYRDVDRIADIAENSEIDLIGEPDAMKVMLDGQDVSVDIRTLDAAQSASVVSTISEVRRIMVEHQRAIGESAPTGCVLEGRDIGSVVFPKADIKFFLTATPEARARRRFMEDQSKGRISTYEQTLAEINERDERDVSREDSPLTIAVDAIVIDTSELDLSEVFEQMLSKINESHASAA